MFTASSLVHSFLSPLCLWVVVDTGFWNSCSPSDPPSVPRGSLNLEHPTLELQPPSLYICCVSPCKNYAGCRTPILPYYFLLVSISVTTERAGARVLIVVFHGNHGKCFTVWKFGPVYTCSKHYLSQLCELHHCTLPRPMCSGAASRVMFFNLFWGEMGAFPLWLL